MAVLNTDDWHSEEWILENIISYQREFGKHRIFFTGLYSAQSKEYEQNTMEGKNFPNDVCIITRFLKLPQCLVIPIIIKKIIFHKWGV